MNLDYGLHTATEGYVPFTYGNSTYHTYYKTFGSLAVHNAGSPSSSNNRAPLVILHGGPGLVHDYLLPLSSLSSIYEIPIIFYDQIGNGRSSHFSQHDINVYSQPPFLSIDLFVEELDNLVYYLRVHDRFDLLGHSWGGVLAAEYEVRKQGRGEKSGLRKLILSNSLASQDLWTRSNRELLEMFPAEVREVLKAKTPPREAEEGFKFLTALEKYYAAHGCTNPSGLQLFMESVRKAIGPEGDPTVTNASILKTWSIIDRLHLIRAPTLIINGRNDISQDFVIKPFMDRIPVVKYVMFQRSSHTPFLEEPDSYIRVVGDFLTGN